MLVATYVVEAGATMRVPIPLTTFKDGIYEIDVHGPNGFYRSFSGDRHDTAMNVTLDYEGRGGELTGNAQIRLANPGAAAQNVRITDNSYKTGVQRNDVAARGERIILVDSAKSHGWYDFTVEVEGSTARKRYAGRVETGRPSFSDPLMGGMV
jgi:phospholipase C